MEGYKLKYPILGQVKDVEGCLWDVREVRSTKHGFDLLFGSLVTRLGAYRWGLPRVIATKELVEFWTENRTKHDGVLFDLPAGRTTLKRLRQKLGFHYLEDLTEFWVERIDDLDTLTAREFADQHDVDIHVVFEARHRLLGPRQRKQGWWQKPKALKLLRSKQPLRVVGEQLSISISQAKRLRDRAKLLK